MRGITILWFGQRWDKYHRRDRELISHLIKNPDINHVILIEPPLSLTSIVNLWRHNYDEDARDTWQRILRHGFFWQPEPDIWVASPLVPLIGRRTLFSWLSTISRILTAKFVLRKLSVRCVVLWIGSPYCTSSLVGKFREDIICYSLCEDFREKDHGNRQMIQNEDAEISNKANLIFVVSEGLYLQHKEFREKTYLIPNGIDVEFVTNQKKTGHEPEDIMKIPRPIIGFAGGINKNIDLNLIFYLAQQRPEWSIVIVGPLSENASAKVAQYPSLKNLHFLGSRPFECIPAYIDHFDVCLLPYVENNRNRCVSSMKLRTYLALGKPVVATPVADAEKFADVIELTSGNRGFLDAISKALATNSSDAGKARFAAVRQQSWNRHAEQIYSLIEKTLRKCNDKARR